MSILQPVVVDVRSVVKYFPVRRGMLQRVVSHVRAVDNVTFSIHQGETFGVVGESGCGKTTLGRLILQLEQPTSGAIYYGEHRLAGLRSEELRRLRKEIQVIFQDPYSSLNPRMPVGRIISEPLEVHGIGSRASRQSRVGELLESVGLAPHHRHNFPHQFSGGQRQRIGIARALALNPRLIVCDEPVSALDVSIQAQVINLLTDLQERFGLTYVFIAHNLATVRHISSRVAVMYLGRLVELAESDQLFADPKHPYTEALISAVPTGDPDGKRNRIVLEGETPSPVDPPAGCRFHPRCWLSEPICSREEPTWREISEGRWLACHVR